MTCTSSLLQTAPVIFTRFTHSSANLLQNLQNFRQNQPKFVAKTLQKLPKMPEYCLFLYFFPTFLIGRRTANIGFMAHSFAGPQKRRIFDNIRHDEYIRGNTSGRLADKLCIFELFYFFSFFPKEEIKFSVFFHKLDQTTVP